MQNGRLSKETDSSGEKNSGGCSIGGGGGGCVSGEAKQKWRWRRLKGEMRTKIKKRGGKLKKAREEVWSQCAAMSHRGK